MRVPESVTTERLLLRQWRDADLEPYAAMLSDPDVVRYLGDGAPVPRDVAWRQMAIFAGHMVLRGFGHWAVELRDTGEFIGRVGPWHPVGWPGLEVGWVIAPGHQGRGYATEAARLSLEICWTALAADRVISLIRPENGASIAVARKLGGELDTTIEFMGGPALVYAYQQP